MINLFVQARTISLLHHTVQVCFKQAQVFAWNMSSSDDDALGLAAFVLVYKRKRERRNMACGVKTG
jgi:hypothetical protein